MSKIQTKVDAVLEKLEHLESACQELDVEIEVVKTKLSSISDTLNKTVALKDSIDYEQARKISKPSKKIST